MRDLAWIEEDELGNGILHIVRDGIEKIEVWKGYDALQMFTLLNINIAPSCRTKFIPIVYTNTDVKKDHNTIS